MTSSLEVYASNMTSSSIRCQPFDAARALFDTHCTRRFLIACTRPLVNLVAIPSPRHQLLLPIKPTPQLPPRLNNLPLQHSKLNNPLAILRSYAREPNTLRQARKDLGGSHHQGLRSHVWSRSLRRSSIKSIIVMRLLRRADEEEGLL